MINACHKKINMKQKKQEVFVTHLRPFYLRNICKEKERELQIIETSENRNCKWLEFLEV